MVPDRLSYRPEIDGLRAIAVISVILFHLDIDLFGGGFVGVDIFFVLSGYLITDMLYREIAENRFSLAGFYERRARRLAPALFVVFIACLVAACFIYTRAQMADFGASLFHAVFAVSNFFFYFNSGYFDAEAHMRPLLHTWSLSVEEQFYLIWPVLMLLAARFLKVRGYIVATLALVFSSIAIAEFWLSTDPAAAFYLLPARLGELAIGAVCVWLVPMMPQRPALHVGFYVIGLCGILASIFLYTAEMRFPGISVLLPTVSTALLVIATPPAGLGKVLINPVMKWAGLVSYSAYLVHWPMIVFYKAATFEQPDMTVKAAIFVATFVLSYLMYRLVEQPFRHPPAQRRLKPGRTGLVTMTAMLAIAFFAVNGWAGQGWLLVNKGSDAKQEIAAIIEAASDRRREAVMADGCNVRATGRKFNPGDCFRTEPDRFNVLVLGSSYAADDTIVLQTAYPEANIRKLTAQGCVARPGASADDPACRVAGEYMEAHREDIARFDLVIVSHNWTWRHYELDPDFLAGPMLDFLRQLDLPVALVGGRGRLKADIGSYLQQFDLVGPDTTLGAEHVLEETDDINFIVRDMAREYGVAFVPVYDILRDDGALPFFATGKYPVYIDNGHFSLEGMAYAARQWKQYYPSIEMLAEDSAIETGPSQGPRPPVTAHASAATLEAQKVEQSEADAADDATPGD
ncbi:acyltransferase family protein [Aquisalinus flavus]|uniref:Acyltransferase n=1 Tax=Aquisalinus flavus TaxID=1526572 RepID=A0A8J2Y7P4_9PROT|nr:acyltransferase family protein [Aquisalinus flavus]MBD0427860.1 acyltransferase [Aquisalinus flavus]GGD04449.1 acyltransferase [Aquisalinus flavus]